MTARLICAVGLVTFLLIAWSLSSARGRFPWRVVLMGLGLQLLLAAAVLRTAPGRWVFTNIAGGIDRVLSVSAVGGEFLFQTRDAGPADSLLSTFAFGVLPSVVFFSCLMSVLYHLGIMGRLVAALAWVMGRTLGTTGPETLAASANVFVGHTEAPLVIRPYLSTMTRSELMAMMTGGFATVTGSLLGAYSAMGADLTHLLTASVISAPAALLIAKIMVPPDDPLLDPSTNLADTAVIAADAPVNVIEAAVEGASAGMKLAINIAAMLIAFLALIALIDLVIESLGQALGYVNDDGTAVVTLSTLLGYLGYPLVWLLGVPPDQCVAAGELLGLKTVANEFIAYKAMGEMAAADPPRIDERTRTLMTYALAGFSNFAAIGIQVGGIGSLIPARRRELAGLGLRAMIGGTLACLMTAAVAGILL